MLTNSHSNQESTCVRRLYSQYYTRDDVSGILVDKLGFLPNLKTVIDLSMGEGALLQAVKDVYPNARLYGCDIDIRNVEKVSNKELLSVNTFHVDSTSLDLDKVLMVRNFDLVIGNPPFGFTKKTPYIIKILEEYSCNCSSSQVSLELLFLLIGIRLLKSNGILSYIIPDGILTNNRFKKFREILLKRYKVIGVSHLGNKRFERTEACTHIITIQKKILKTPYNIKIESIDHPSKVIFISKSEFINRADYSYNSKAIHINSLKLKNLDVEIIRGKLTKSALSEMDVDYIHTTSFVSDYRIFYNANEKQNDSTVREGDIVLARVGTRVIGKVGLIVAGNFHISDCIIAIRVGNKDIRESILKTLNSPFGKSWLQSISKGVGARHITLNDLKELPVSI